LHQEILQDNKIPNLKHQNTNKSQIAIFNDPKIHYSRIVSLGKPAFDDNNADRYNNSRILFGILNLGYWDLFEIWSLVLGNFMSQQLY
jgi:hypothetical protein